MKMQEGILNIDGKTAVCTCGGEVEGVIDRLPVFNPWAFGYEIALAYSFNCTRCGAFGFQAVAPFVEDDLEGAFQMRTVQFRELEELIRELPHGAIVRVQALGLPAGRYANGAIEIATHGIAVRTYLQNTKLAWFLPVTNVEKFPGQKQEKLDAAWEKCRPAETAVKQHLANAGLNVRPGYIHINPKEVINGEWEAWEKPSWHVKVKENNNEKEQK